MIVNNKYRVTALCRCFIAREVSQRRRMIGRSAGWHRDKISSRLQIVVIGRAIKQVPLCPQTHARAVERALLTRNCLRSDETNARNPAWFAMRPSVSPSIGTVHLADCWKKEINELPHSSNKTSIICAGVAQFVTQDFVRLIRTARLGVAQTQSPVSMRACVDRTWWPNRDIESPAYVWYAA